MDEQNTNNQPLPPLRPKTKAFVDKVLSDPKISHTQAYLATHGTTNANSAKATASQLLAKPNVIIYMKKHEQLAKQTMIEAMRDTEAKWADRISAARDVLDRNLGKPTIRTEVETKNLNINVEASVELGNDFTMFLKGKTEQ